jgi:hypothetical protein
MASLKERLADTCICSHAGRDHTATDRGTHIALDGCTIAGCDCKQFRRIPTPTKRSGRTSLPGHGKYLKKHYRI